MSGHSKWATIKRKKGAKDAKRGILFTRLSKDLTLAAKAGGSDPGQNPSLRLCIKKAKAANMPVANIDRAIKKGAGELPGMQFEDILYEGYGPGGVAILLEVMTENRNRTVPEIRHIMSKNGGNLGESGCVSWMFEKKGIIHIDSNQIDEDALLERIIEFDIDEFELSDNFFEIIIKEDDFEQICSIFDDMNLTIEGEISLIPSNQIVTTEVEASKIFTLISLLEEHDDVQKVHSNLDLANVDINNIL